MCYQKDRWPAGHDLVAIGPKLVYNKFYRLLLFLSITIISKVYTTCVFRGYASIRLSKYEKHLGHVHTLIISMFIGWLQYLISFKTVDGCGLLHESLRSVTDYTFSASWNIHYYQRTSNFLKNQPLQVVIQILAFEVTYTWYRVFKIGLHKFLKTVFHKIYLVNSWILCFIFTYFFICLSVPHHY